jgi:hypothetical protein
MCDCGLEWKGGVVDSLDKVEEVRNWASNVFEYSASFHRRLPTPWDTYIPIHGAYLVYVNEFLTRAYCISTMVDWPVGFETPIIRAYFERHREDCYLQKKCRGE